MISKPGWTGELLGADVAFVRLVSAVSVFMLDKVERLDTSEVALVAFERFLP